MAHWCDIIVDWCNTIVCWCARASIPPTQWRILHIPLYLKKN